VPSLPLDDENLPLFTVGQVSAMLEIQQAFLRRLDEHRVVRPSRSSGGQRRYTRREIGLVQYVVELVNDGMTLAGIRRVLELEARVSRLEAERHALLAAVAERDRLLSQWFGPAAHDVLPSARDGSPSAHDRPADRDQRPPG
jgi:MerR family transcriptional regulator, heat shock protein HspR